MTHGRLLPSYWAGQNTLQNSKLIFRTNFLLGKTPSPIILLAKSRNNGQTAGPVHLSIFCCWSVLIQNNSPTNDSKNTWCPRKIVSTTRLRIACSSGWSCPLSSYSISQIFSSLWFVVLRTFPENRSPVKWFWINRFQKLIRALCVLVKLCPISAFHRPYSKVFR